MSVAFRPADARIAGDRYWRGMKNYQKGPQKKIDIYVVRIGNNGNLMNSRPCANCTQEFKKYNIRRIYYSNERGEIVYERAEDMVSTHISKGNRARV